ncbi:D-alanyl-D-alanine carboxypeptidase family protein [Microbacterium sp. SORGH_AS_0862]|uniref:D-alanyl-D-alanine carboxypeptidase family protein n=1 Tax=Microbacterium sp. SORGH_AS_0862 TaxID=3041789 RepID=UPI0027941798|nr:D-alanyl-D-alanine carboxypeptidase [Microbacterium sp. SORGH_AS_0862]MDQ1204739.1 D-alanyl-D-alanine carboxypeptidase (penicillin-binding protein 5/6) [Microbacterium sp. SORGH_AS_0862]
MTVTGPTPPTRRSLRHGGPVEPRVGEASLPTGDLEIAVSGVPADAASTPARIAAASFDDASEDAGASVPVVVPPVTTALSWVDEATVAHASRVAPQLEAAGAASFTPVAADLLARAPRRTPWRPGVIVPVALIVAVIAAYCGTTLLWPLHAIAPTVQASAVEATPAAAAVGAWPGEGSAAVVVDGVGSPIASSADARSIASITKVVTAMVVLDQMPLAAGEQGQEFAFSAADESSYWSYRRNGESALNVPVGGTLTEYQMLQGMLMGSANNYADRLADTIWPNNAVYARAANDWLAAHGVSGITIAGPAGIEAENTATPEALLKVAKRALADPVIAEIVRTPAVELPGAGLVENTNNLLADPGVVGLKTGTLDSYNLLAAKDVTIGDTSVRIYAATLGQPDVETRDAATRALFAQVEQELQLQPSVAAGTTVGRVETRWGASVPLVTAADADVVLWNGSAASVSSSFDLGDAREPGDVAGTLVATGPKNAATVDVVLDGELNGPSPWWRLTHPLELFGLV